MAKPKLAMQTDRGRFYRNRTHDDRKFISVTTALKVLDKPALVGWAARTVAEEFMAQLPAAVRASRAKPSREAFIKEIKGSPYAKRDKAANRGTEVHEAAEAHILGKPRKVAEEIEPFVVQLLDAIETLGMTFEASEATVANPEIGYAGTGDIWATLTKHLDPSWTWLLDIKTGDDSKPIDAAYPEYAYQLSALAHCPELWLPDHTIIDAPKVDRAAVLNLRPSGWAMVPVPVPVMEPAFVLFSRCVEIAALQTELKDGLFEPCVRHAAESESPFVPQPTVEAVPA
jgi:hypothetical protein